VRQKSCKIVSISFGPGKSGGIAVALIIPLPGGPHLLTKSLAA
jgi:hypothetical protein